MLEAFTLLAVFAHPDDESFCAGGALALAAAQGARVVVLCATRGEAGNVDRHWLERDGVQSAADLRTLELERACAALGAEPPLWLTYHDSGLHSPSAFPKRLVAADTLEVARDILEVIAAVKPDVLLGFDPHGYYAHPDHIAMHRAAQAAFLMSGHLEYSPQRLYYPLPTPEMLERFGRAGFGQFDARFAASASDVAVRVDASSVLARKRAAIAAHASQSNPESGIDRLLPELRSSGTPHLLAEEVYALGATRATVPTYPLENFFVGLETNRKERR